MGVAEDDVNDSVPNIKMDLWVHFWVHPICSVHVEFDLNSSQVNACAVATLRAVQLFAKQYYTGRHDANF